MISAVRNAAPASLDGTDSTGGKERQKAIAFYADPANREESYDFKAYKGEDVVAALEAMFGQKCAYCESEYGAVAPTDIEHYRPKGAVKSPEGKLLKPGYYWLAAEWANLLPSCIDCNRARGHDYEDGHAVTGKANDFPLADERTRATTPGAESAERPLLLDPTVDDPGEHLEFIAKGVVRPALAGGSESLRGKTTIEVLGLTRPKLNRARRDQLLWVEDAIATFKEAAEQVERNPEDQFAGNVLARSLRALARYMDRDSPYAALARQRIQPVLDEVGISLP